MGKNIIINKNYFTNIEKAIASINNFFSSDFKTKDFPDTSEGSDLDGGICSCIASFEDVNPQWIVNPEEADEAVDKINAIKDELVTYSADRGEENFFAFCSDKNNQALADLGHEYLSFKALQEISDNFPAFEKLLNGIYSFELFTTPSAYKSEIERFSDNVPTSECDDILSSVDSPVFDAKRYINGLFENEDITFPDGFDEEAELTRFLQFKDLTDVEVQVTEGAMAPVQEAAEVNYFSSVKPRHIKYENGKWSISDQFKKTVTEFISELRKLNTTDELKEFLQGDAKKYASDISSTVAPFILVQAMVKKSSGGSFDKYTDSYKSIISKNKGAKRFENYDLFTTFKADKTGTIKFLEDFFNLRYVNDSKISISNNTILTLFNIFDSRIYYDIMYNMIPEKEKKEKGMDEDSFVRTTRAGINKNSRASNSYASDVAEEEPDNIEKTSSEIKEYALSMMKSLGDMDVHDMIHCEAWQDMLHAEIETLGDSLYNVGIPTSATAAYIGEGFDVTAQLEYEAIMESDDMRKMVTRTTVLSIIAGGFAGAFGLGFVHAFTGGGYTLLALLIARDAGRVGGGVVGNKIAKSLRGKGIKSEIVRDINDVIRCLTKETDEIDNYIIKDLKKRCKTLAESLNFAMKRKKTFDDDQRETLMDLHHATQRIIAKTSGSDVRAIDLKSVTEIWLKNADKVLKMLLNTNDAEVKAELRINSSYDLKDEDDSDNKETTTTDTNEGGEDNDSDDDDNDNDDSDDDNDEDDENGDDEESEEEEPKTLQEALITTARNARKQVVQAVSKVIPDFNSIIRAKDRGSLNKNTLKRMYGGIDYETTSSSGSVYADNGFGVGSGYSTKRNNHVDSKEMRNILKVMKIDNKIFKKSDKKDRWRNKFSDTDFEVLRDMHEKLGDFVSDVRDCLAASDDKVDKMIDFVVKDATELISIFEQIKKFESVSPVAEFFTDMPDRFKILTETEYGKVPAYMQSRIALSDESGKKKQSTVENVDAPSDDGNVPSNNVDDMADSIDEKIDAAQNMDELLGKEAKKEGTHIVYNVTNNYNYSNSFNKTSSNDLSTGKTIDNSIHTHKHDLSSNDNSIKSTKDESVKAIKSNDGESNNKYNSTGSSNTKEIKRVKEFSTGFSIDEVFAFLESEEPLLEASGATKPKREDSLTKAMDLDRKSLPKQQAAKKAADDVVATTKAVTKPVVRTKHWLLGIVDSLVKRREDKVKADLIQSPSYRTAVFRAGRIALKAGLLGVAFTVNMYLGIAYAALLASNAYDKQRLRKEVEAEFAVEMRILDDKIRLADQENTPEARKAKWQMMRLRGKMERIVTNDAMRAKVIHPTSTQ